jgi:probable F420-dependent oxidoreductase
MGDSLDEYARPELGGRAGATQPTGPDGAWLEPLTVLAAIAAVTSRIRLGTQILLGALRTPVVLAKQLATLDVLSHGRVDVGVGVGWQQLEYDAAGLDFTTRGRRLDEALEICCALWRDRRATIEVAGRIVDGVHQMPKPVQSTVPVWVSGTVNPRVARRIARFGSGWIPWGPDEADLTVSIPRMRAAVEAAGGDPATLRVLCNLDESLDGDGRPDPVATCARLTPLVAGGATDFVLHRMPRPHHADEVFARWAEEFRLATGSSASDDPVAVGGST